MSSAAFYSAEFPRGALSALFSGKVLGAIGTPNMPIELEHRNSADTSFTSAGTISTISATGDFSGSIVTIKEICRFKFSFTSGSDGEGYRVLMGAPAWYQV